MTVKPDDGDIVAQTAVPILPDDTAREVFDKVTVAAEMTLDRVLPALAAGNAPRTAQDLSRGSYFGGRRPEDGIIDWNNDATTIHNLVRAVAPPYPGAFTRVGGIPVRLLRTRVADTSAPRASPPVLETDGRRAVARCGGGGTLDVLALEVDGAMLAPAALAQRFGAVPVRLGPSDA
jgi:methionyl-tRNA formyltransferase